MPRSVLLTIPGEPVPKGRPRCTCIGKRPRLRTPDKTIAYEARCAILARATRESFGGPVSVDLAVFMPRPKSRPKHVSLAAWKDPTGPALAAVGRADVDNIAKAVIDGMQAGGMIANDNRVVRLTATKQYHPDGWVGVVARVTEAPAAGVLPAWLNPHHAGR